MRERARGTRGAQQMGGREGGDTRRGVYTDTDIDTDTYMHSGDLSARSLKLNVETYTRRACDLERLFQSIQLTCNSAVHS